MSVQVGVQAWTSVGMLCGCTSASRCVGENEWVGAHGCTSVQVGVQAQGAHACVQAWTVKSNKNKKNKKEDLATKTYQTNSTTTGMWACERAGMSLWHRDGCRVSNWERGGRSGRWRLCHAYKRWWRCRERWKQVVATVIGPKVSERRECSPSAPFMPCVAMAYSHLVVEKEMISWCLKDQDIASLLMRNA